MGRPESALAGMRSSSAQSTNLDLVRATAVLCVFGAHLADTVWRPSDINWHFGQLGVLIFFVHTSLVLMRSMERMRSDGWDLVRRFYIRRVFRIYPLAMVCVLGAYFAGYSPATGTGHQWSLTELAANLTLTENVFYLPDMWHALWSLPLEVQMYVLLPPLFLWLRRRGIRAALLIWLAAVPLAILCWSTRASTIGYAPCFLAGIAAWRIAKRTTLRIHAALFPVAFAATWIIWMLAERETDQYYRWAFCLALGCTLPWFEELRVRWISQPAKLIANYSYGIYLGHGVALALAFRLLPLPEAYQWPVFVALAIGLPVAMYHGIEAPMIAMGKQVALDQRQSS